MVTTNPPEKGNIQITVENGFCTDGVYLLARRSDGTQVVLGHLDGNGLRLFHGIAAEFGLPVTCAGRLALYDDDR